MSAKIKTIELLLGLLLACLIAAIILAAFATPAHGQELPSAPSATSRPMWDFWATWGFYGVAASADGWLSSRYAGVGAHPCGVEGNPSYAYPNGKFKAGMFARNNALLFGGLFTVNYVLRKKAPAPISRHWALRLFTDAFPVIKGQEHARYAASWSRMCF